MAWFILALGLIVPYLARLAVIGLHGWAWLRDYVPSWQGVLFIEAWNLLPLACVALFARTHWRHPRCAFYASALASYGYLAVRHAGVDLSSNAYAGLSVIGIPMKAALYALGAGLAGLAVEWVPSSRWHRLSPPPG